MDKEEVAFLKKSSAKDFLFLLPLAPPKPVMPAEAGIHAFLASPSPTPVPPGQKFFAELFYKKATTFLFPERKGVDGRFRGHYGLRQ